MTSRIDAAKLIAAAIEANDYETSVWTGGDKIRVYVTIPAASWKKKAQQIGYVAILENGEVESELDKQSGTIMAMLPDLQIDPAPAKLVVEHVRREAVDEDVAQHVASEQATNVREINREIG